VGSNLSDWEEGNRNPHPLERLDAILDKWHPVGEYLVLFTEAPVNEECVEALMQMKAIDVLDFPLTDVPLFFFENMAFKTVLRIGSITDKYFNNVSAKGLNKIFGSVRNLILVKRVQSDVLGSLIPQPTGAIKCICIEMLGQDADVEVQTIFAYTPNLVELKIWFQGVVSLSSFVKYAPNSLLSLCIETKVSDIQETGSCKIGSVTDLVLASVSCPFECNFFRQTKNHFEDIYLQGSGNISLTGLSHAFAHSAITLDVLDVRTTNLATDDLLHALRHQNCSMLRALRADWPIVQANDDAEETDGPGFSMAVLQMYLQSTASKCLEILTLRGHTEVTDNIFNTQFTCISNLRQLDLRDTNCRSDRKIAILRSLKNPPTATPKKRVRRTSSSSRRKANEKPLLVYMNKETSQGSGSDYAQAGSSRDAPRDGTHSEDAVQVIWDTTDVLVAELTARKQPGFLARAAASLRPSPSKSTEDKQKAGTSTSRRSFPRFSLFKRKEKKSLQPDVPTTCTYQMPEPGAPYSTYTLTTNLSETSEEHPTGIAPISEVRKDEEMKDKNEDNVDNPQR
jgi:hypothetical protein